MESKLDSDGKSGKDNKDFEAEIIYNSNLYRYNKKNVKATEKTMKKYDTGCLLFSQIGQQKGHSGNSFS